MRGIFAEGHTRTKYGMQGRGPKRGCEKTDKW